MLKVYFSKKAHRISDGIGKEKRGVVCLVAVAEEAELVKEIIQGREKGKNAYISLL
jgi:hypothetical protein